MNVLVVEEEDLEAFSSARSSSMASLLALASAALKVENAVLRRKVRGSFTLVCVGVRVIPCGG